MPEPVPFVNQRAVVVWLRRKSLAHAWEMVIDGGDLDNWSTKGILEAAVQVLEEESALDNASVLIGDIATIENMEEETEDNED